MRRFGGGVATRAAALAANADAGVGGRGGQVGAQGSSNVGTGAAPIVSWSAGSLGAGPFLMCKHLLAARLAVRLGKVRPLALGTDTAAKPGAGNHGRSSEATAGVNEKDLLVRILAGYTVDGM